MYFVLVYCNFNDHFTILRNYIFHDVTRCHMYTEVTRTKEMCVNFKTKILGDLGGINDQKFLKPGKI